MIKQIIFSVLAFTAVTISAQKNSASPYSYFGIGENFEATTVEQSSMGGVGVAAKETHHVNFINPASTADLRAATYAIGGSLSFLTIKDDNTSQSGNSTNLRYIALGFPLGNKAGMSIGLQPFSSVGYSLLDNADENDVTLFEGEGGTNKIYANFGSYVYKGFSIGAEASYIFGNIDNSILNQRSNTVLATKQTESLSIRGGQFKFGAQYKRKLKNDLDLNFGSSFTLATDLSAKGSEQLYTLSLSPSGGEIPRFERYNRAKKGDINVPLKSVFGVGFGKKDKWFVEVNQQFQSAIETTNIISNGNTYKYEDSNKFSIGGFYIPKVNSISSYWKRVTYRAGLRVENTGLMVKSTGNFTSIKDFGINVGLGLPLPRQLSNVNLGFEYGQRGTTDDDLIKENYFNVRLSLSLNSLKWFNQRRID